MNVGRMMEFARLLVDLESRFRIQKRMGTVAARMQDIINAPQDVQHQTNTLAAVDELRKSLQEMSQELTQPVLEFLAESGGNPFFLTSMGDAIGEQLRSSGITPGVAKSYVDDLIATRNQYLDNLKGAGNNLKALKFKEYTLSPGDAEIGFKIPRTLFKNKLGGLAHELTFIDFTVFTFSEAVTGEKKEGDLAQLSTTDPVILLAAAVDVVAAIAGAVKWLMDAYAKYLEILEMKARLREIEMPAGTLKELESRADKKLEQAIEEVVERILKKKPLGRLAEVANALRFSLKGLIARVERGMTIEVRFLPAPKEEGQTEEQAAEAAKKESELQKLQRDLVFPQIPETPLLAIPAWPACRVDTETAKPRRTRKKREVKLEEKIVGFAGELNGGHEAKGTEAKAAKQN